MNKINSLKLIDSQRRNDAILVVRYSVTNYAMLTGHDVVFDIRMLVDTKNDNHVSVSTPLNIETLQIE